MNETNNALRMRPVSLIGEGERGEVFVGMDEVLRRRVVVKKLLSRSFESADARQRLIREAQTLARLDHPHILRIHDYTESRGYDVFTLEYAPGRTLAEALGDGLDFARKVRIATAIASALVVAHRHGIVHGALSPDSVLLGDGGEIKLTNFASTATQLDRETPRDASITSDMYAFGLLLRELFGDGDRDLRALAASLVREVPSERSTATVALARLQRLASRRNRRIRAAAIAVVVVGLVVGAAKYTFDLQRERAAAIAARTEAEKLRAEANDLVGFMLDDIRPKLWSVGRLEILDATTEKALDYFATMRPDETSPHEASVNVKALVHLSETQLARAELRAAKTTIEHAIRLGDKTVHRYPNDVEVRFAAAMAHAMTTQQLEAESNLVAALAQARVDADAFDDLVRRQPRNLDFLRQQAYAYSNLGTLHDRTEEIAASLQDLETAIAVKRQIAELENTNEARFDVGITVQKAGLALIKLGRFAEARTMLEAERAKLEAALAQGVAHWRMRQLLAVYVDHLVSVAFATGDLGAALRYSEEHLATSNQMVAFDPANVNWKQQLVLAHRSRGIAERMNGNLAAALRHHQMSVDVLEGVFARGKQNSLLLRNMVASRAELARTLLAAGRAREAAVHADLALEVLAPVRAELPMQRSVADALLVRGETLAARGDAAGAKAAWEEGLRVAQALDARSPDPRITDTHARFLLRLGRNDRALPLIDQLSALGYRNREFEALCREKGAAQ